MKRMIAFVFAMSLVLGLAGLGLAQEDTVAAPKGEKMEKAGRSEKAFKNLGGSDDKVTRDEFMAEVQKRAAARWAKLDPTGKGYLTKEEFMAGREKAREKSKSRKAKAPEAPATPQ
jgi:hypothetical protein